MFGRLYRGSLVWVRSTWQADIVRAELYPVKVDHYGFSVACVLDPVGHRRESGLDSAGTLPGFEKLP